MRAISIFIVLIALVSNANGQTYSFDIMQKKSGATVKTLVDDIAKASISKTSSQSYSLDIKLKKSSSALKFSVDDISKITLSSFIMSLSTVASPASVSISTNAATLGANVVSDGNSTITERGVVWSTSYNPTITTNLGKKTSTGTTGLFTVSITGLTLNTIYHFRGYAINSIGTGYTRDTTFTTLLTNLATPSLLTPPKNSYGIGIATDLKWSAVTGVSSYDLQIAADSNFANIISNFTGISSVTKTVNNLAQNAILYWRVRSVKSGDTGIWSNIWNFRTASSALTPPIIIYPLNNAAKVFNYPVLKWDTVAGATNYDVIISDKSDLSNVLFQLTGLDSTSALINKLSISSTYYWKLLARNDTATSEWTSIYKFTTSAVGVGVHSPEEIVENYTLSQNYPNPFNPGTNISYSISEPSFVTIIIYDVYGREIETLVNENQPAGRFVTRWEPRANRGGLSTGVYYYKMRAGKYSEIKKMLFVK
jgi:hypothetical protein